MAAPRPHLAVGTPVEVRNRFCAAWSADFEIAERSGNGYRVRRRSDGYVLPTVFGPGEVRPLTRGTLTTRRGDRRSPGDEW